MDDSSSNPDIFDVARIRRLVELMEEHNLSQLDLRQGDTKIRLRRGGDPSVPGVLAPVGIPIPNPTVVPPQADQDAPAPAEDEQIALIKSPMVGTFYTAADPDSPAYVKVGDHVGPETTVCIVEAMKVFNQIPAEVSGKVLAVLIENGEPVEFGQPMFKVDTRE